MIWNFLIKLVIETIVSWLKTRRLSKMHLSACSGVYLSPAKIIDYFYRLIVSKKSFKLNLSRSHPSNDIETFPLNLWGSCKRKRARLPLFELFYFLELNFLIRSKSTLSSKVSHRMRPVFIFYHIAVQTLFFSMHCRDRIFLSLNIWLLPMK